MLRNGDTAFKQVIDAAMTSIYKSGQINAICDKWFLKPIPATLDARALAQHSIEEKHRYA